MSTTVQAPAGAHFEFESVKTAKGTQDLGEVPLLAWDSLDSASQYYGEEGIIAVLDGTSLRVSFQSIARRFKAVGKSDDEIAKAQVDFRPGKRQGGASTPVSRARKSAEAAASKVSNPEAVQKLLDKIASGELSEADLDALAS